MASAMVMRPVARVPLTVVCALNAVMVVAMATRLALTVLKTAVRNTYFDTCHFSDTYYPRCVRCPCPL